MADPEAASLISTRSIQPAPATLTKLIKRIRALTFKLLPVQVNLEELAEPTSRVITPKVINAYAKAAGDFGEALPYCLLRARQTFIWDANHSAADYDEHMGRAIACEVLARRIVHNAPQERLKSIMSTRYRHKEWDGDDSSLSSALELAIDQHCTIFLSSNEAQFVIDSLWSGTWVQQNNEDHDIDFRQPLEKVDPHHDFDFFEGMLYTMALAFSFEETHRLYTTLRYFTWRAFGFWTIIGLITNGLLIAAFVLRIMGIASHDQTKSDNWHFRSFQVLACVRVITVLDGFKYIGTMQICVARMMQESTIFFVLLSILLIGFYQGMYALDAADGVTDKGGVVMHSLLQALLQAPDFNATEGAFGLLLYYMWCLVTTIVLLNVLISLFSSAYEDVVGAAESHYLAFVAGKTVSMIRAPDSYVYPAPFNLIEIFFIAPLEPCMPADTYAKLNRAIMRTLFWIPLTCIALFEATLDPRKNEFTKAWFEANEEEADDNPEYQDPDVDSGEPGVITKTKFEDLVREFPNTSQSMEATIINEIQKLRQRLDELTAKMTEPSDRVG
ncbi:related to YVC1-vacuolar cation channel [Serendipita indica DSM 11827]|uniref:Related to YVC1-vacuolar cation channel n=1 Tax=Serendipita indica (strain DSM 11827) TaxID=1109443 RepID=G4T9Y7_SERID|nr:related to YVC1-vacuolar cation channel [Serendipita indica DSM 11827]